MALQLLCQTGTGQLSTGDISIYIPDFQQLIRGIVIAASTPPGIITAQILLRNLEAYQISETPACGSYAAWRRPWGGSQFCSREIAEGFEPRGGKRVDDRTFEATLFCLDKPLPIC